MVDLAQDYLRNPGAFLYAVVTDLRTWWPVLVAAVLARFATRRWWRRRCHARLAADARVVTVSAPPEVDPDGAAALFSNLVWIPRPRWYRWWRGRSHIVWEYVVTDAGLALRVWVPGVVPRGMVERAIQSAWPGAQTDTQPATPPIPLPPGLQVDAVGGELRLTRNEALPLRTDFPTDPIRALLGDARSLVELTCTVGTVVDHRDSDSSGVTTIADRLDAQSAPKGFAAFTREALAPHTDSSATPMPPHLVLMSCAQAASVGGECVAVDASAVYDDLAHEHPTALANLLAPRTVLFGGAAGYLGAVFTRLADDRLAVRLRLDNLATFSPLVARHLPAIRTVIDRHSIVFMLRPGQGYVLDNYRWLHGRCAFRGDRVFYRVHSNPSPLSTLPRGFTPSRVGIHAAV